MCEEDDQQCNCEDHCMGGFHEKDQKRSKVANLFELTVLYSGMKVIKLAQTLIIKSPVTHIAEKGFYAAFLAWAVCFPRPRNDGLQNSCFQILKQSRANDHKWENFKRMKERFSREFYVVFEVGKTFKLTKNIAYGLSKILCNDYPFFLLFRHPPKVFITYGAGTVQWIFPGLLLQRLHWNMRAFYVRRMPGKQKQILDQVSVL